MNEILYIKSELKSQRRETEIVDIPLEKEEEGCEVAEEKEEKRYEFDDDEIIIVD